MNFIKWIINRLARRIVEQEIKTEIGYRIRADAISTYSCVDVFDIENNIRERGDRGGDFIRNDFNLFDMEVIFINCINHSRYLDVGVMTNKGRITKIIEDIHTRYNTDSGSWMPEELAIVRRNSLFEDFDWI